MECNHSSQNLPSDRSTIMRQPVSSKARNPMPLINIAAMIDWLSVCSHSFDLSGDFRADPLSQDVFWNVSDQDMEVVKSPDAL